MGDGRAVHLSWRGWDYYLLEGLHYIYIYLMQKKMQNEERGTSQTSVCEAKQQREKHETTHYSLLTTHYSGFGRGGGVREWMRCGGGGSGRLRGDALVRGMPTSHLQRLRHDASSPGCPSSPSRTIPPLRALSRISLWPVAAGGDAKTWSGRGEEKLTGAQGLRRQR